eukprot:TRINITY_DN38514_c0_g1_i1.p2 TRINITY_DN38514_c0_g1~~TRINITY_DN38514_c0_g1_i1.p2  ORF type:complete len:129 (+),score=33.63 TRINITY_DN38514_c0_g1_i1:75-461(+)
MDLVFFFQAEDGIRDVERSRGLGDVYKRQVSTQSTWGKNEKYKKKAELYPKFIKYLSKLCIEEDNKNHDITNFLVPILVKVLDFSPSNRPSFSELSTLFKSFDLNEYRVIKHKKNGCITSQSSSLLTF